MSGSSNGSGSRQSKKGSDDMCDSCFATTKYVCISCDMPICNKCSCFETNEEQPGWVAGKRVGYCETCYRERKVKK